MTDGQNLLLRRWRTLSPYPGGRWLLGRLIGRAAPYAATISPEIVDLAPGLARIAMRERPSVRNHLRSIHAVALVNLGELAANLALMTLQPRGGRFIVTGLQAEYVAKARGRALAECRLPPPDWSRDNDIQADAIITDGEGKTAVRLAVRWRLGPVSPAAETPASEGG